MVCVFFFVVATYFLFGTLFRQCWSNYETRSTVVVLNLFEIMKENLCNTKEIIDYMTVKKDNIIFVVS